MIYDIGRPTSNEVLLKERLEKADFVDLQSFTLRISLGPWAKEKCEPLTGIHSENSTQSQRCIKWALKKLGVMMLNSVFS
jgi:hypothetical protein